MESCSRPFYERGTLAHERPAMPATSNEIGMSARADGAHGAGHTASFVLVGACATIVFAYISLASDASVPKYRYSFAFLVPLVWLAFWLRSKLPLGLVQFTAFSVALLLHDLGAFGWYQRRVVGLQYDWCVHAFFGLVGGWVAARALHEHLRVRGWALVVLVVLMITGIGGLHEIMESASTRILGTDYGMLVIGADNPFDTQEDLLNNVIGSSVASAIYAWSLRSRRASAVR